MLNARKFHRNNRALGMALVGASLAGCSGALEVPQDEEVARSESALFGGAITGPMADPSGTIDTISTTNNTSISGNLFFQSLGTNGRACSSCHLPNQGMTISPPQIQALFNSTQGTDPLFRTVDGSNSPNAPVATLAQRQAAYSMLLNRGLIRIGLPMPANAEFTLTLVESLNVSVTAAILLHAATAARPGDLDHTTRRRLYARWLYLSIEHAEQILAHSDAP